MSLNHFCKHIFNDSIKYNSTILLYYKYSTRSTISFYTIFYTISFSHCRALIFHLFIAINIAALAYHYTSTLPKSLIIILGEITNTGIIGPKCIKGSIAIFPLLFN